MTSSLVRQDLVDKQLRSITIKAEHASIDRLVKSKDLIEEIARIESDTIASNIEDIIVNCGDLIFHLLGKRTEKNVIFSYPKFEIRKLCRGAKHRVIHWHGPYLGFQSDDDAAANKEFLHNDKASEGCAVGIDGIQCRTLHHDVRIPWSDEFYDKLKKTNGVKTYKDVKALSCEKISGKKKNVRWICNVEFKDGKGNYKNLFNEVTFERGKKDDMTSYAFQILEDNEKMVTFAKSYNEVYDDSDEVYCSIMETETDHRILSCFKTTI